MAIHKFDSIASFVAQCNKLGLGKSRGYDGYAGSDWSDGLSTQDAMDKALHGDITLVARAEQLIEKITAEVESTVPIWQYQPYGAMPCIPVYLTGDPAYMRHLTHEMNERAPIRLYIMIASSGSFTNDQLVRRGCATLALYMLLKRTHSVELHVCHEGNGTGKYGAGITDVTISSEIDMLSSLAFCLAHPAFDRQVHMPYLAKMDTYRGAWPNAYGNGGSDWELKFRELLALNPQDVYIPGSYLKDANTKLLLDNPVAWVQMQMDKQKGENTSS